MRVKADHCGRETVHYTVGAMQGNDLIGKVPRLDNYRTNRKWTVEAKRGRRRSHHANVTLEGSNVPNTYERKALAHWVAFVLHDYDQRLLSGEPDLGEPSALWYLRSAIGLLAVMAFSSTSILATPRISPNSMTPDIPCLLSLKRFRVLQPD